MSASAQNLTAASKNRYAKHGEVAFSRMEKVNSEMFALTYGSIVCQLLKDSEQVDAVNNQLEKMGYNIGIRLIEEFLAKSGVGACVDFRETAEVIAKVGMKMFLGIDCEIRDTGSDRRVCSLVFTENPLAEFVELPPHLSSLMYSNIIVGVIRGALEQVHIIVGCKFIKDMLRGDDRYEIRMELKKVTKEEFIDEEDV